MGNAPYISCCEQIPIAPLVDIDIKAFIKLIAEKKYREAAQKIKEQNALPAVCGRVYPQEDQYEKA